MDEYERRLTEVAAREEERRKEVREERTDGGKVDDGFVQEEEGSSPACPVILDVDLSVADSRLGADGSTHNSLEPLLGALPCLTAHLALSLPPCVRSYEAVPCQAGVGREATAQDKDAEMEQDGAVRHAEEVAKNATAATPSHRRHRRARRASRRRSTRRAGEGGGGGGAGRSTEAGR